MGSPNWSNVYVQCYFAFALLFAILAALSVAARFYSARLRGRGLAIDDWMVAVALVIYWIMVAVQLWGLWDGGLGEHVWNVTQDQLDVVSKELTTVQFPYACVLVLTRLSICILLLRVFIKKWIKRAVYVAIVLNAGWWLFLILDGFLICRPFRCGWRGDADCVCDNKPAAYLANAGWGIFNDLVIWSLPHFTIWKLNTTKIRKIAITFVFVLGFIDIIVSLARIFTIIWWAVKGDETYSLAAVEILSYVECSVAIMVACLIMCRPLLERLVPSRYLNTIDTGSKMRMNKQRPSDDEAAYHNHWPQSSYRARVEALMTPESNMNHSTGQDSSLTDILVTQDVTVVEDVSPHRQLTRSDYNSSS